MTLARPKPQVIPYANGKTKRGRRKELPTEGYACPCRECVYFGNSYAAVHALVGYGKIGKGKAIQRWQKPVCPP
ncbi:MAG: hypothetical protein ABI947_04400 [Chloroflexota bacterium]